MEINWVSQQVYMAVSFGSCEEFTEFNLLWFCSFTVDLAINNVTVVLLKSLTWFKHMVSMSRKILYSPCALCAGCIRLGGW